jgi:shikimate dehydrogenase
VTSKTPPIAETDSDPTEIRPRPSVEVGLIGTGIQASLSPRLHEAEGIAMAIPYRYRIFDVPAAQTSARSLAALLDECEGQGLTGLNVTHPFKQAILPMLDALSDEADAIGAANTVLFRDGRRIGHNTDWWGFSESFRRRLPDARHDRVLVLGAGGAGAAIAYALLKTGTQHIDLFDLDMERAAHLAERISRLFSDRHVRETADPDRAVELAQGIVNATPVGMERHAGSPLRAELLHPTHWVADVVYFPLETQLLRDARAAGCPTLDGGGMAVFQAAKAFELFSGKVPDTERMLGHFSELTDRSLSAV